MKALPKELTEAHRQGLFMYGYVILDITRIIHIQDSHDEKSNRYACCKCQPGPARNLHIVSSPCHQKSHRYVDQYITQTANGKLKWFSAIEIGNRHTC